MRPSQAPRYDQRLVQAITRLDDESEPIAEICRRIGRFAEEIGVTRPSYSHLRRLIRAERRYRHDYRHAVIDAVGEAWRYRGDDLIDLGVTLQDIRGQRAIDRRKGQPSDE